MIGTNRKPVEEMRKSDVQLKDRCGKGRKCYNTITFFCLNSLIKTRSSAENTVFIV